MTGVSHQDTDYTAWLLHRCVLVTPRGHSKMCWFILKKKYIHQDFTRLESEKQCIFQLQIPQRISQYLLWHHLPRAELIRSLIMSCGMSNPNPYISIKKSKILNLNLWEMAAKAKVLCLKFVTSDWQSMSGPEILGHFRKTATARNKGKAGKVHQENLHQSITHSTFIIKLVQITFLLVLCILLTQRPTSCNW